MRRIILVTLLCLLGATASGIIVETGSLENFLIREEPNCEYDNWVSHLAEGIAIANYNLYAPYDVQTNGFGDFRIPNATDILYWNNMLDLFTAGDYEGAQTVLTTAGSPFQIVEFHDTDTGRTYFMIREIPNLAYYDDNDTALDESDDEIGAFAYGWGLFIYNPAGTKPAIITVPHPCDDFPTPIMGLDALRVWNAKYLLINGAGREVRWTNEGTYTNSKSLSDPTRYAYHPLQTAYKKFADKIRDEEGWREWSAQIHTYDWNRHPGYPNSQISAGNPRLCPNLPIRDLSPLKIDLLNAGEHLMIPANTVGIHRDVYLSDFYSVNYSVHEFTFDDGFYNYPVNDYVDLPAYTQNQQMVYTQNGTTDYDVYEPFFHVEMDELPNCYEETTNNLDWFYGWNEAEQRWDMDNLFTNYRDYYLRWVDDLEPVLVSMFEMNDNQGLAAPTGLSVLNQSMNNVTLMWSKTSAYDFDSYEILYAPEPIGEANYQLFDRTNASFLASPDCETIMISNLVNSNQYYFKIRARDKNGNVSDLSNEVNTILAPANITSLTAHGMDDTVRLYWQVGGQTNNQGFSVYRKGAIGDFVMVDSWQTNPALIGPTSNGFEWWDANASNGETFTYKISCTNLNNVEFFYNFPATASPRPIHSLTLTNSSGTMTDSVSFGINPFASDGNDSYWDTTKANPGSNYVWTAFWEQYWGNSGTQLSREIKGNYNTDEQMKTWVLRTRSDQLSQTLTLSASANFDRYEKLYLLDGGSGTYHNLLAGPYQYTNSNSNIRTMTLYWGNMQPRVLLSAIPNRVYQGGSSINFTWNFQYPFLIDHMALSVVNSTDSLQVSALLPNNQYSYNWLIPQNVLEMQDCRLAVDVYAVDGVVTRFWSDYHFSLVPYMYLAYNEGGWKTRSNPWLNTDLSFEQVFGTGAVAYETNTFGDWVQTTDYDFGSAYWVHSPDISFYSGTHPIQSGEYNFDLIPGWNFIPNPHLCAYDLEDLSFNLNGNLFRLSEMISQGLVSRAVFVQRGNELARVSRIEPWEALLIKYYGSADLIPQIRFYPFFNGPDVTPSPAVWQLEVSATQADNVTNLVLGAHVRASDLCDFAYDLPAPPAPPYLHHEMWFSVADTDTLALDDRLSTDFRSDLTEPNQMKYWDFLLSAESLEPITFAFDGQNIPQGWQLRFDIEDQTYYIGSSESFTWTPPHLGVFSGFIRVSNYMVANDDQLQGPVSALTAYPNPFNPDVSISFSLAKSEAAKVEIFNLRGQKVNTLADGRLASGKHVLIWNGKDERGNSVASGIYFARIKTKSQTRAIKMMLMK